MGAKSGARGDPRDTGRVPEIYGGRGSPRTVGWPRSSGGPIQGLPWGQEVALGWAAGVPGTLGTPGPGVSQGSGVPATEGDPQGGGLPA